MIYADSSFLVSCCLADANFLAGNRLLQHGGKIAAGFVDAQRFHGGKLAHSKRLPQECSLLPVLQSLHFTALASKLRRPPVRPV